MKSALLSAVLLGSLAGSARPAEQEPTGESFEKLFACILPKEEELAWQKVPWRRTLWEAVTDAQKQDMPILLWAMNGHPLACT